MQDQPKMKPPFQARVSLATVFPLARQLKERLRVVTCVLTLLYSPGKKTQGGVNRWFDSSCSSHNRTSYRRSNPGRTHTLDDIDIFPFPITEETVLRGQQRFDIFCSVCHGKTGYGDGMIVRRGYRRAASFHDDRLRTRTSWSLLRRDYKWLGRNAFIRAANTSARSLGHHRYIRALQASQNIKPAGAASASPTPASQPEDTNDQSFNPPNLSARQTRALIVGVVGLVVLLIQCVL